MGKGFFVAFEGIDGSGKTTQLAHLAERLVRAGKRVLCVREPGSTGIGERLRELLLDPCFREMDCRTEVLLYAAARAQLVVEKIAPALEEGSIVLSDRFSDSTLAYQGWGRGMEIDFLIRLNQVVTGGLRPDLVVLLDLPVEEALARIGGRRGKADRLEKEMAEFYRRVRRGYLSLAAAEPERYRVIDALQDKETVSALVAAQVEGLLL